MLSVVKDTVLFSLFEHWLQASVYWFPMLSRNFPASPGFLEKPRLPGFTQML